MTISTTSVNKSFHLPSSFKFSTWKKGSWDQSCQHLWFSEFDFLHHDREQSTILSHVSCV